MTDLISYIEATPEKLYGKPVVKNTRIAVDLILEKLASGDTIDELLEAYPLLTREAISACLLFAAHSIKNEVVFSTAS